MPPQVAILIITHNSAQVIGACLDSITSNTSLDYEIIIIDNASQDGTPSLLRTLYPAITLVENQVNTGFARAVNQAERLAQAAFLFLLNPDTRLHAGALDHILSYMGQHPQIGICCPRTEWPNGAFRQNCYLFPTPGRLLLENFAIGPLRPILSLFIPVPPWRHTPEVTQAVEAVSGAALLIQSRLFQAMGGLDERFFMYMEDFDLSWRVHQAGWQNIYLPLSVVTHSGGHSLAADTLRVHGMAAHLYMHSLYQYIHKHFGLFTTWILRCMFGLAGLLIVLLSLVQPNQKDRRQGLKLGRLWLTTPIPPPGSPRQAV